MMVKNRCDEMTKGRESGMPDTKMWQGFFDPARILDRLADLVPPPRKHRHRYHGVFAPNHKLRYPLS